MNDEIFQQQTRKVAQNRDAMKYSTNSIKLNNGIESLKCKLQRRCEDEIITSALLKLSKAIYQSPVKSENALLVHPFPRKPVQFKLLKNMNNLPLV